MARNHSIEEQKELEKQLRNLIGKRVHLVFGENAYSEIISELHLADSSTKRFRVWSESIYPQINVRSIEYPENELPLIRV